MAKYIRGTLGVEPDSSSSDSETDLNQYIIMPRAAQNKPDQELHSSSSDEEDSDEPGSGSERDSDGSYSDPKLSAMAAMPGASDRAVGKKRSAARRAAAAKRYKNNPDLFNRFFCEEDECTLLRGMLLFAQTTNSGPLDDLDAFHRFVVGDLKVDPTTEQLKNKIYKLERKYIRNLRQEQSGKARKLKAHEKTAYELSKLAWANEHVKNQKLPMGWKKAQEKKAVMSSDDVSRIGAQLFETGKGLEGEKEWHELKKAELEVNLKKLELKIATTTLILDALNSKKS